MEIERRVLGEEHSETLRTMSNLGMLYDVQGKYAQAEALDERTLAVRRRISGTGYASTLIVIDNLADLYTHQGKYRQAEALALEALEAARRALGEEHPDTLDIVRGLADVYSKQGKYRQAAALYARVATVERRVLGEEHPDTLNAMASLGRAQLEQLKFSEAEITLHEALNMYERARLDLWERYRCRSLLGASLAAQKRFEEAETLLLSGYEGMIQRKREIPAAELSDIADIRDRIVQLYRQWGKPLKAAEWQQKEIPISVM